jgi:hypothetical protein
MKVSGSILIITDPGGSKTYRSRTLPKTFQLDFMRILMRRFFLFPHLGKLTYVQTLGEAFSPQNRTHSTSKNEIY